MSTNCRLRAQDLADRYGVGDRSLLLFESHGLLKSSSDEHGRFYTPTDEHRLRIILKGLRLGFSLHEIAMMFAVMATLTSATLLIHSSNLCQICLHLPDECLQNATRIGI